MLFAQWPDRRGASGCHRVVCNALRSVPNISGGGFHVDLKVFASHHFPELVIKPNPNRNGARPGGSNITYFDVPRTLQKWRHLPRPRMSLQCRDIGALSASVKIMLGRLAFHTDGITVPDSLFGNGRVYSVRRTIPRVRARHATPRHPEAIRRARRGGRSGAGSGQQTRRVVK